MYYDVEDFIIVVVIVLAFNPDMQERLLESGDHGEKGENRSSWAVPILGDALRMVFQNLLLESDETVIQCSQRVWRLLLQVSGSDSTFYLLALLRSSLAS